MALIDDILSPINAALELNLEWLTTAYGKVQKIPRKRSDGSSFYYPGIYSPGATDDYLDLLPDRKLGNYCYWEIQDGQEYENIDGNIRPSFSFKLVFWFYWPDLYVDYQGHTIEEVKAQILNILTHAAYVRDVVTYKTFESAPNIYSGYGHNEIDRNFLEYPYGGIAIEGELIGSTACSLSISTPTIPGNVYGAIPFDYNNDEKVWPYNTWFGAKIYCRSWSLGDGADAYVPLTGLTTSAVNITLPFSTVSGKFTDSGKPFTSVYQPSHDGGVYEVLLLSGTSQNYVTVFYTK